MNLTCDLAGECMGGITVSSLLYRRRKWRHNIHLLYSLGVCSLHEVSYVWMDLWVHFVYTLLLSLIMLFRVDPHQFSLYKNRVNRPCWKKGRVGVGEKIKLQVKQSSAEENPSGQLAPCSPGSVKISACTFSIVFQLWITVCVTNNTYILNAPLLSSGSAFHCLTSSMVKPAVD